MGLSPPIPRLATDIDAGWITAALNHAGHDVIVDAAHVVPVGTGQMATSLRATMTYEHNGSGAPTSLVIKISSDDPSSREAGARGAYLREVRFYEHLDTTVDVATPACLWSAIDISSNLFVLVLEDMAPAEQGDQIAGCSVDDAVAAIHNIAGLHAPRWCDESLFDFDWLTPPQEQRAAGYDEAKMIMGLLTPGFIDRYRSRMSDAEIGLLRWFADHVDTWLGQGTHVFGLTHADHRLDNLLFAPEPSSQPVTVVDWQTIGVRNPLADVAYLLGTGLEPDVRRQSEQQIVTTYHQRLLELGVTDYPFERCFDDYREQSLHALLITVLGSMMTGQTDRGDDMFMAMLHRSSQQIFDLDASQ